MLLEWFCGSWKGLADMDPLNGARAVHELGREVGGGSHAGNALWRTFRCRSAFPVAVSIGVILGTLSIALVASRQRRGAAAGPAHGTA